MVALTLDNGGNSGWQGEALQAQSQQVLGHQVQLHLKVLVLPA